MQCGMKIFFPTEVPVSGLTEVSENVTTAFNERKSTYGLATVSDFDRKIWHVCTWSSSY